jgi:6-phosphogluconolactonase (cycloisomerase 2 family)
MDRRTFLTGAASLVLGPRALAHVSAARELALVTADLEARLVAVDLATGRVHAHIRTLPKPRSIETVGDIAVVAHSEIGALTLVAADTLTVARVLRGFGEPRYTAAHPDGRHAYVTDASRGEIVVLDVLRGRVVGRAPVGALARHLAIDPSGRRLWIALGAKAEQIAVVDIAKPARPRLLRHFRPPFLAHDVGWTPDRTRVWVSSGDRNELAIYAARSGKLVKQLAADEPPQHFTFRGDLVYVASGESGTLHVHRVDGHGLRKTAIPKDSYNVQQAHGWVVTPGLGTGTLCALDRHGRARWRKTIARSSHDACIVTLS